MANLPVISLNAGQVTPLIDVRSDTEKYSSACRILENMIPRIYGPVERRPGTLYRANVDDDDKASRIVSFIYSATIAYEIEFADQIINVYYNGSAVDTDIASPYLEADLPQLQFKQSADVMWITHPSYNPRKLSRTSATEFSLDKISFETGPFIGRNDIVKADDVTIAATGYTIATATSATNTLTITSTTDIDSLFPVNQRIYITNSTGNDGAYTIATSSWTTPTMTITTNESFSDDTNDGQIMVDGGVVTLTASSATFTTGTSGHVDSLWKLIHKREQTVTKISKATASEDSAAIDVKGDWSFTTHGNWEGTAEILRNEDGTNWEVFRTYTSVMTDDKGSRNIQKSDVEDVDGVQYKISYTQGGAAPSASSFNADLVVDESTQDSIFKITAVASTTSATATAIVAANEDDATKRWAEGAWSHVRGWPSAMTFFDERAVYGFTNLDQQDVYLSKVGDFENFTAGTLDDSAFTLTLPTSNRGRWLGALEVLAAGTTGEEWRIRSTSFDEALTPTNFSIKEQTSFGSADIQVMGVNEALIFVDFVGRKVRELTWSDPKQKYVAPDLTAMAEDITSGGITSMAVQKRPDAIIWFTISNSPYLISMTYEREQNVVAWAEHLLGGDGVVESVCVTPGSSEDVITLTVKRTINGSTVRFIEEIQPRDWGSDDNDAYFVDAGIIDTGGSTTISGLTHLEGETVSVLGDGAKQPSKTVSGGSITIDEAADTVHVGLPYTYRVQPMRLDITTAAGTTHGSIKKISELVISFYKTLNAQYGDGVDTYDINWRTTEAFDSPPDLFTGDKTVQFDGGFSTEDTIIISGSDPFPCTVRAIIPRIEKTGR